MKKMILILLTICSLPFCLGCKSPKDKGIERIQEMMQKPISIPFAKMSCWINDTIQENRPWEDAKLKLVVYTDSNSCSECTLKRLYLWNDFVQLEPKYEGKFAIIFIFQTTKRSDAHLFASKFHMSELEHPMYIDSNSEFEKNNPHIPNESFFHVFLLDENNNVILVGSPLFDSKIEDSLNNLVKEKTGL